MSMTIIDDCVRIGCQSVRFARSRGHTWSSNHLGSQPLLRPSEEDRRKQEGLQKDRPTGISTSRTTADTCLAGTRCELLNFTFDYRVTSMGIC